MIEVHKPMKIEIVKFDEYGIARLGRWNLVKTDSGILALKLIKEKNKNGKENLLRRRRK
jgi:hypothetical protein